MPASAFPSDGVTLSAAELIQQVRLGSTDSLGDLLEIYRRYLRTLASSQVDGRLQRRMSTSDLVQETMLAAHRDFAQFRGRTEGELLAWLRQILSHCVSHAVAKHVHAQKRDLRREVVLDRVAKRVDDSMARLSHLAVDRAATPSEAVGRREMASQLDEELAKLKPNYRQVIIYRNMQGLSFDEISQRMGIRSGAARMLWMRAVAKFKEVCEPLAEEEGS